MENINSYRSDYSVYPGQYVPLLKEEEVQEELKHRHKDEIGHPQVNITEWSNSFKVEVAIPGAKREEFLIRVDENVLSIQVLHQYDSIPDQANLQVHEFDYNCFDRHIALPEDVDVEFASAKYVSGILLLHMQKAKQPGKNCHIPIVVY